MVLGHPFAPVPWDISKAPPKRGKSVEELVSESWDKERCMQMLHLQQQQVVCQQDFGPTPGHWEHQAYLAQANGMRQQSWEYEDWDRVPYRECPPRQFFYQSPEAVYEDPRKPQEWAGNHCFYEHREDPDYSDRRDHRDFVQSPRTKERPDHVHRYHSWESDEYEYDGREPYSRRDRHSLDRDRVDYYKRDVYRDVDCRERDYHERKDLDKYDRYKHYDQERYKSRKDDRYRYREIDRYDGYDHREKDQHEHRKDERAYFEDDRRRCDRYQYRDSRERRDHERYVQKKDDYDYKEKGHRDYRERTELVERDNCKYKSGLDTKDGYERKKSNHYDRYAYREIGQSELKDPHRQKDHYQYRKRDPQEDKSQKDERHDSGVKDCYEDKGCDSDHCDPKIRERYRDLRSVSEEHQQEGYNSDHSGGRYRKECEKDVYQKQALRGMRSYEDPVHLSSECEDQVSSHPGKADVEKRKPVYVGSLDRNSFYRKTAPSSLRKSEYATNRKKKQGKTIKTSRLE